MQGSDLKKARRAVRIYARLEHAAQLRRSEIRSTLDRDCAQKSALEKDTDLEAARQQQWGNTFTAMSNAERFEPAMAELIRESMVESDERLININAQIATLNDQITDQREALRATFERESAYEGKRCALQSCVTRFRSKKELATLVEIYQYRDKRDARRGTNAKTTRGHHQ